MKFNSENQYRKSMRPKAVLKKKINKINKPLDRETKGKK